MTSAHTAWLERRAHARAAKGRNRTATVPSPDVIDCAGNDYLGLSRDERVIAAAVDEAHRSGIGARASRVVTGTHPIHEALETALADLCEMPAALVTSSGYTANLAAVTALAGPGCLIVIDAHAHASLVDAARLSRSPVTTTPHNDVAAVADALAARREPRALVITESIFSVLGDAAPLADLHTTCTHHGALLLIDEAHGIGVAGGGRGLAHATSITGSPSVILTATLSKALGAQGGTILATPTIINHLTNEARSIIFDTALAPPLAAAAHRATTLLTTGTITPDPIHHHATRLTRALGISASAGAVQSVPMPSPEAAVAARDACAADGVLVGCFRPPAVPDGISRLRLTTSAHLTTEQIDTVARVVARHTERR